MAESYMIAPQKPASVLRLAKNAAQLGSAHNFLFWKWTKKLVLFQLITYIIIFEKT
jgi:hypothetical protein